MSRLPRPAARPGRVRHVHWLALGLTFIAVGALLGVLPENAEATRSKELPLALPEPGPPLGPPAPAAAVLPLLDEPLLALPAPSLAPVRNPAAVALPVFAELDEATPPLAMDEPAPSILPEEDGTDEWRTIAVKSGDSFAAILARQGIGAREVHDILSAGEETRTLVRLFPGEILKLRLDQEGRLQELLYESKPTRALQIWRGDNGFEVATIDRPLERRVSHAHATIESSLFAAAHSAGLSDNLAMEIAKIFGWDIDFALDIRRGDRFAVLHEELYLKGDKIGDGPILAAEFTSRGRTYRAVRFVDEQGHAGYYTPDGESMRKAFLRTPVEFSRISSGFNPNRRHPVLNTIRAHRGVDYAAPTGTPVRATGNGRVVFRGNKGGYGRTVVLEHGSRYRTLYAHLNGYARGLQAGQRVRQGQIIGYVGMSGLATGPHLHYEFQIDGVHRDPLRVPLPHADPIGPGQRPAFVEATSRLLAQLDLLDRAVAIGDASSAANP
jgi:murein DD-endopeptidase MepM/ murein hydrolase activator NlpD